MTNDRSEKPRVAIIKSETPQDCFIKGIEELGGISQFIEKDDTIFLKLSLRLPFGYPTNSNFDLVEQIIKICKQVGAKKIFVGSFPFQGISTKLFDEIMELEKYFKNLGAEYVYLDNSNHFSEKSFNSNKIKKLKHQSLKEIEYNNEIIQIPNIILNSDKLIIVNQVNVNPLFMCDLSLLNLFSITPQYYQDINYYGEECENIINQDKFKKDLISKVLDVYSIKKPTLIINDIFYILEKAGPIIYKDSKLKKTNLLIMGNNLIATDSITLQVMGFDIEKNDIMLEIKKRGLGPDSNSDIKCLGENLGDISVNTILCCSKLEDVHIQNLSLYTGEMCSGCFLKAYHLLNLIKSIMIKDLKYISNFSFLLGINPPEPQSKKDIILFGKCAINTTQNYDFHTLTKKRKKKKKQKKAKNKNILELPGCPPDLNTCLTKIYDYFGKTQLPDLNLMLKVLKSSKYFTHNKNLKIWEEL